MPDNISNSTNPNVRKPVGGKRPGSGRKPNYLKRLGIKAITAADLLAHVNEIELWKGLLNHKSADVRLRTLSYLTDRRDGKPKQAVDVTGGIIHPHTTYRDPLLAALSQEELQTLNAITAKLALPAVPEPKNQAESGPASITEIASEVLKDVTDG
jgi:hypothetical protein